MTTDFAPVLAAIADLNQKVLSLQSANLDDEKAASNLITAQEAKDITDEALITADSAADEALKIVIEKLKEYGVATPEVLETFRAISGPGAGDLAKIFALLMQYGPQIAAFIKLFLK